MRSQLHQTAPRSADRQVTSGLRSGEFGSWSGFSSSRRLSAGISLLVQLRSHPRHHTDVVTTDSMKVIR
jgi:hypothetical protein